MSTDVSKQQKTKPQRSVSAGVLRDKCLTMTYFHRRPSTIIGAKAFHGPVRDGKAWDHLAMVVKRNWVHAAWTGHAACQLGSKHAVNTVACSPVVIVCVCTVQGLRFRGLRHASRYNLQGYRIKPHGQLVLVSCMHCCTSTPSLSTSWSRTTL